MQDICNDFATDFFMEKNCRIRPTSVIDEDKKDKVTLQEDEEDRKFNEEVKYDIMTERKETKDRKKKEEAEAQILAEKLERKKKAKQ